MARSAGKGSPRSAWRWKFPEWSLPNLAGSFEPQQVSRQEAPDPGKEGPVPRHHAELQQGRKGSNVDTPLEPRKTEKRLHLRRKGEPSVVPERAQDVRSLAGEEPAQPPLRSDGP